MPDISGFTKFVQGVEIEHSSHIISELLELLIDQNELDLQLAEVEGDALFYFKYQDLPSPGDVLRQARRMFRAFHRHLSLYETNRICQCGACISASNLKLKFIIHGGQFDFVRVKELVKPHGPEVIKAHRLLKNGIDDAEYILISDDLRGLWDSLASRLPAVFTWSSSTEMLDMGEVKYWFTKIVGWKSHLEDVELPAKKGNEVHLFSAGQEISLEPKLLFELVSNLKYREKWTPGVDQIEYQEGRLNRRGEKHVCVIGDQTVLFETLKPGQDGQGQLVYAERTVSVPAFRYADFYFTISSADGGSSSLIDVGVYGKPSAFWSYLLKPLISMKMKKQMKNQLADLKSLAEKNDSGGQAFGRAASGPEL